MEGARTFYQHKVPTHSLIPMRRRTRSLLRLHPRRCSRLLHRLWYHGGFAFARVPATEWQWHSWWHSCYCSSFPSRWVSLCRAAVRGHRHHLPRSQEAVARLAPPLKHRKDMPPLQHRVLQQEAVARLAPPLKHRKDMPLLQHRVLQQEIPPVEVVFLSNSSRSMGMDMGTSRGMEMNKI